MRKTAVLILALLLMLGLVAGCADNKGEDKTFTVGFDAEFPPYGYMDDNGEYTGFDLDLAQEVCERRGWELVKQPINWDSKDRNWIPVRSIASGTVSQSTAVKDDYTWSSPYVNNSQVFVVAAFRRHPGSGGSGRQTGCGPKGISALAALKVKTTQICCLF